ncbi:hypothetical protein ETQ85_25545 [Zoogloea oleivorans]|uniref:Uncharacterized protein n=1 Tax=Zoogloea oleivorans TaxID=1552750 RepID=A0A6C2C8S6_9RHOO|nr:hypothetical protein [Zoogloea oleivorans]TYC49989.1 hypothetical protein ETQ85_25545 [Zoogloea oleivorans]
MIFSWFNAAEAKKTATTLAENFAKGFPADQGKPDKKSQARKEKAAQMLFFQAKAFAREHRLNIYKKARFGQAFQKRLAELGYNDEFSRTLTQEVLVAL